MMNTCRKYMENCENHWFDETVLYHIYPLGMLGCERSNDGGEVRHRLPALEKLTAHLKDLGMNAVYFGPLFESSTHGYDTRDYFHIDRRLGDDDDFRHLVEVYHEAGIRVIVDAVFNHVGRDFWAFREAMTWRDMARTRNWFKDLRFDANTSDGIKYSTWEGHKELVKLNLGNPDTRQHLLDAVSWWINEFHIDGIRLDAADCLDPEFVRILRAHACSIRSDFLMVGEVIHGDYRMWANPEMMHGTTNYEAYKGLWSSHNDGNFHEIAYSLNREFGDQGIYRNLCMYNFVDNHDVDRIATRLRRPFSLYSLYAMMFLIPGTPSVYYGSEWGILGKKGHGYDADLPIRPMIGVGDISNGHVDNCCESASLKDAISKLAHFRLAHPALCCGNYRQIDVTAQTLAFERSADDELLICCVSDLPAAKEISLNVPGGIYRDILNGGESVCADQGVLRFEAYPHWARVWQRI
jgi:glycosidase